jgi:molybdopterin converting factor small subunit
VVLVRLPSLLAEQAGGQREFEVDAATVGEALRALPVADLLLDERGDLRPLVNVYVDGEDARRSDGLETALDSAAEVRVIAAVAGGDSANGLDIDVDADPFELGPASVRRNNRHP